MEPLRAGFHFRGVASRPPELTPWCRGHVKQIDPQAAVAATAVVPSKFQDPRICPAYLAGVSGSRSNREKTSLDHIGFRVELVGPILGQVDVAHVGI